MNKTKAIVGGIGVAAVLAGVAFGSWQVFEAIMSASPIQQFMVAVAGIGGGGAGAVAAFRHE